MMHSNNASTRVGSSLARDDRIDAVVRTSAHFQRAMMMDIDQAAKAMRDEQMAAEIEDFLERFNQPTYRGMRVNGGPGGNLVVQRCGGLATTGRDADWIIQ